MRVLVVGGTGSAGRPLVTELQHRGHDVAVLGRTAGKAPAGARDLTGDLTSGAGLVDACRDVHAVVHVANGIGRAARPVLVEGTHRLVDAAAGAGVGHVVVLSICGVDRTPLGYHRAKVEQERAVAAAGVPWSILRATQFHELLTQIFASSARRGAVLALARTPLRPVAATTAASALADLVDAGPSGHVSDLAGPAVIECVEAALGWRRATGVRRPVLPLWLPGEGGRMLRAGALVPDRGRFAGPSYAEWLAGRHATRTSA